MQYPKYFTPSPSSHLNGLSHTLKMKKHLPAEIVWHGGFTLKGTINSRSGHAMLLNKHKWLLQGTMDFECLV